MNVPEEHRDVVIGAEDVDDFRGVGRRPVPFGLEIPQGTMAKDDDGGLHVERRQVVSGATRLARRRPLPVGSETLSMATKSNALRWSKDQRRSPNISRYGGASVGGSVVLAGA